METTSQHVQLRLVGDVLVARLVDVQALYEHGTILEIGEVLYGLVERPGVRRLLVDLEAIEFAATEMIAKLVSLNRRAAQADVKLTLCGLGAALAGSLRSLKLDVLFDIQPSEAAALGPPPAASLRDTVEMPQMP